MTEIILYPLATEKAQNLIWQNKITFCVDTKTNKPEIKREVERLFDVKVIKVNTVIRPDGRKIAYVKLHPSYKATDLAVKLGLV